MSRRNTNWFILIVALVILALWVDLSDKLQVPNPFNSSGYLINRDVSIRLGLDLRGGLQTLLEADVPADRKIDPQELNVTRQILENRANGLGVSEVVMQTAGDRRIVAEFPGVTDPEAVVKALQQTGLLEFVDMGLYPVPVGTVIQTDVGAGGVLVAPTALPTIAVTPSTTGTTLPATETAIVAPTGTAPAVASPDLTATLVATVTPSATATQAPTATPQATFTPTVTATPAALIYHTVFTGAGLDSVGVQQGTTGGYQIAFSLKPDAAKLFADHTSTHLQQYLAIVLDKRVISAPIIQSAITSGQGVITGSFTVDEANNLAIQLRYGSLPIPVKVVESRTVGPTLGEESVRKSVLAGAIGLTVVILFMALYYRLPGLLADLALLCYAIFTLAIYKIGIPGLFPYITLTLPGIAGFILSVGMAVDANILIFERMKEELRGGKNLRQAIDLGWSRAWPSIRDSNIATLITCFILFVFGSTFGASMVKGFSITLALGVGISLFTAINVTRTFLHLALDATKMAEHPRWFGL